MAVGAVYDLLAALLLCHIDRVDLSLVNGEAVVGDGQLFTINIEDFVDRHNPFAAKFVSTESA